MGSQFFEVEQSLIERGIVAATFPQGSRPSAFTPKRLLLQWHITDACNLRCSHCYQDSYQETDAMPYELMTESLGQYIRLLSEWGIGGHINFTGGEPFLQGRFLDLLERVYDHRKQVSFAVLTNGTLLSKKIAVHLKKLDCKFVQVSLEGGKSMHDSIRGPGSFEKAIAGLRILRKAKIHTMVSFTSHRSNAAHFSEVAEICSANRIDVLWSDRLVPLGTSKDYGDNLMRLSEVKAFFDNMYRVRMRLKKKWFNQQWSEGLGQLNVIF
jgi:MoaA/NifB/PqqE/SkfB family radical SAM enzyme